MPNAFIADVKKLGRIASAKLTILLGIGLFPLCAPQANAGGTGWNGGADQYPFARQAAWFLSQTNEPIQYCLKLSPGEASRISPEELRSLVEKAFGQWVSYIRSKKLLTRLQNGSDFSWLLQGGARCLGGEDLRIELGTSSPEIETEKKKYQLPVAFSAKGTLKTLKPGSGYRFTDSLIWLSSVKASDKNTYLGKLKALLVHEFGHVFGNGHIEGTVMSENMGTFLSTLEERPEYRAAGKAERGKILEELAAIDQQKTLIFSPFENNFRVFASTGVFETNEVSNERRNSADLAESGRRSLLKDLLGFPETLGEYLPAVSGNITLASSLRDGFRLILKLEGKAMHTLNLGKPVNIAQRLGGEGKVLQRVVSFEESTLQSFDHESKTIEFRRPLPKGGQVPVFLHLNRHNSFFLEVGDPEQVNRWWTLLHSKSPSLSP